ncbi:MAG: hypothetical protein CMJ96_08125 [Planctomycetes bacterium]|jgi:Holliday junction resolvase-like predicted endonuclease|nr:hypothetical protein [Planctomycetota bacterium]MDP6129382.1 YraN family protein [Planctomycetota bacterium]MDP7246619.1 YraN family protein [Planctomycetota bacterium]
MGYQKQGRQAEDEIATLLLKEGWFIHARNLRTPFAEVDLVGLDLSGCLVVVEVKSRHPLSWGQGETALGWVQRRRLARALNYLSERIPHLTKRMDLWCVDPLGIQSPQCYSGIEWKPGL